jgi:hypothetical protein
VKANCHCGRPELRDTAIYRWAPGTLVTYWLRTDPLPAGLSWSDALSAIVAAADVWPQVCGVQTASGTGEAAHVLIEFATLDPSGVELGLTQLPTGVDQVTMQLNIDVAWTVEELAQVAMHEFGHALGFVHTTATPAIMNPIYQPQLAGPQPDDVAQALERYPLAAPAPAPVEPAAVPTLTVDRSLAIDAIFTEAGDTVLGIAVGAAAPVAVPLRIPAAGAYRITVELEAAPKLITTP